MVNCSVFLTLYVICGKSLIICSFVITELVRQPIQDRLEALEYGGTSRNQNHYEAGPSEPGGQ